MQWLPPETPTLLASCFWPTTKERIYCYQREGCWQKKVQSTSDQKSPTYRENESSTLHHLLHVITSPNTTAFLSAICHACHASRQGPDPKRSRTGCCAEGRELRVTPPKQPAPPSWLHPCTPQLAQGCISHVPPDCEQCLRAVGIVWNQQAVLKHSRLW